MILTAQQEERMSVLMEGTKVIGTEDDCPVVEYPNGRWMQVTRHGRMIAPSRKAMDQISKRLLKQHERHDSAR